MTTSGPVQNIQGAALPVTAVEPPPEGRKVVPITVTLTSTNYAQSNFLTLGTAQTLTQVRTIYIDNTQNNQTLTITHGAANQTTTIPAQGTAIVPTTSYTATYSYSLSVANAPSANTNINLQFFNYEIPPATSGVVTQTIEVTMTAPTLPNPFHNPGCQIYQRQAPVTCSNILNGSYGPDGWCGSTTGTPVNYQFTIAQGGKIPGALSYNSLAVSSLASHYVCFNYINRKLIAANAAPYAGRNVLVQFKLQNTSTQVFTNEIYFSYCNSTNNFSAYSTPYGTSSCVLSALNPGQTMTYVVCLYVPTQATNGLILTIGVENNGVTASAGPLFSMTDLDMYIDLTNSFIAGTQYNSSQVSPPRLPRFEQDLLDCQFYYQKSYGYSLSPGYNYGVLGNGGNFDYFYISIPSTSNNSITYIGGRWLREMFATPTMTTYSSDGTGGVIDCLSGSWSKITPSIYIRPSSTKGFVLGTSMSPSGNPAYAFDWTAIVEP